MRASPLIEYSSTVLILCLWIGAITNVFSSLIGLFQQDIKKVIAYSTMSQLAREYNQLIIFRHQTIYEKVIVIIYYTLYIISVIIITIEWLIIYLLFYLFIGFIALNGHMPLYVQHPNELNSNSSHFLTPQQQCIKVQEINNLNPYYVTGFVDGEGCFLINIPARSNLKLGYNVNLMFKLKIHSRDIELLKNIRNYLGQIGNITTRKDGYVEFIVSSKKDIEVLIKHFDSYPLITQKWSDYQLFKQTFMLIKNKEHLTIEGLKKIISLKAVLNNGLSDQLKESFPDVVPALRPQPPKPKIQDPHWMSGFVDAEGCFFATLTNNLTSASLIFKVTQHIRDAELLKEFINYFNCGYYRVSTSMGGDFIVTKFSDISTIIIPFFNKYPILGSKSLDFYDFVKIAVLIQNKAHLTPEGFEQVKQIKSGMNKGRIIKAQYSSNNSFKLSYNKRIYGTMSAKPQLSGPSMQSTGNRHYSSNSSHFNEKFFNEWLGGLIDVNGQFLVSKKGYANLKITLPEKDKSLLYEIKHKFGGSIKSVSGSNAFKYKLHHKKGLIKLVNSINGLVRNPPKILQLNRVCALYNIELKANIPLTYYNGWFSGIIDADGSIDLNKQLDQLILSIAQKNIYLLDPLIRLYSGRVKILSSKDAFQYSIYRKNEILNLVDNYFNICPLKSSKAYKLKLIKDFYIYKDHKKLDILQPDKFNKWINFKNKWDKS
jgi:hypothetical protein